MSNITHADVGKSVSKAEWAASTTHLFNGSDVNVVRSTSYVIAAPDASTEWKAQSDKVSTSGSFDEDITAALTAGHYDILLSPGIHTGNALTTVSNTDVTISGCGRDYTTITLADNSDCTVLKVTGCRPTLRDFTINGNGANQASGNGLDITGAYDFTLTRVNIKSVKDIGFICDNETDKLNFWITDVYVFSTGQTGAYFRHMAGIMARGLLISSCGTQGHSWDDLLLYQSLENSFTNCVFDVSARHNVNIVDSQKNTIANSYIGGAYETGVTIQGDYFASSNTEGNIIIGNTFNGNGTGNVLYAEVTVAPTTASTGLIIANNQFSHMDARAGIGIQLIGTINNAVIMGNTLTAYEGAAAYTTPIKVSAFTGTGTIIRDNPGYVTENSGTATVANGTTTIKVAHGLTAVPTRVQITCTGWGNAAKASVTSKDSDSDGTKFTITVDADPGVSTATFDWRASIGEGN